jgi:hypothetical protein
VRGARASTFRSAAWSRSPSFSLQTGLLQLNVNTVWQVGIVGTILIIVLLIDNLALIRGTS